MNETGITCSKEQNVVTQTTPARRPAYRVKETDDAYLLRIQLPGVSKSDVEISVVDDVLTVVGARTSSLPSGWKLIRRESAVGDYRLKLNLNRTIDESRIAASQEDGVLELTLPKSEALKPRQIKVS